MFFSIKLAGIFIPASEVTALTFRHRDSGLVQYGFYSMRCSFRTTKQITILILGDSCTKKPIPQFTNVKPGLISSKSRFHPDDL